jgi:flagellar basal body L-ring protein FlgH
MASDVEAVMVNGNMVINDRRLMTVDEAEILYKAKKWCEKIRNR